MDDQISIYTLHQILRLSAELGATIALIKAGHLKRYLNKSEAFKKYGRRNVEHWVADQQIKVLKDGDNSAAWRLDRIELEVLAKAILLTEII
ncbi:MAG: hypothetical protein EOP49_47050 [Sphingobacteriales bacterium]|nr:MAG: hypothetical protein EOP49_47050 [Sphingobacteriales bacterium]